MHREGDFWRSIEGSSAFDSTDLHRSEWNLEHRSEERVSIQLLAFTERTVCIPISQNAAALFNKDILFISQNRQRQMAPSKVFSNPAITSLK